MPGVTQPLDRAAQALVRALVPRGARRIVLRRMRLVIYHGSRVECPCCGSRFSRFMPGLSHRDTRVCPRCDGSGSTGFYRCDQCDGHGLEWRTARVDVLFPRPVHDGTVITASLNHLGVQNFYLCVRARVMSTA